MLDSPHASLRAKVGSPWPLARLLVAFVLDIASIARGGGSILDVLILTAVVDGNLAELSADRTLQQTYATLASPPPDALRRPVSVSSVAATTGLPYETVRRHLVGLSRADACVSAPGGVLVPASRLSSDAYARTLVARYERTRELYRDLLKMGLLQDVERSAEASGLAFGPAPAAAPVRLCNRLLSGYYLQVVKLMLRRVEDPVSGLILLAVARANMAGHLAQAREAPELLPDTARRPASRAVVANYLGLPAETVRRRLIDLQARGYCKAVRRGLVINVEPLRRPESLALLRQNQAHLLHMFSELGRCGVLDYWDREPDATAVPGR